MTLNTEYGRRRWQAHLLDRSPPGQSKLLTLTVVDGPLAGEALIVQDGTTVRVGRSKSADLFVMDPNMSRIHFVITGGSGEWVLRDVSSHNGLRLNGRSVQEEVVADGDLIGAGFTTFQVRIA